MASKTQRARRAFRRHAHRQQTDQLQQLTAATAIRLAEIAATASDVPAELAADPDTPVWAQLTAEHGDPLVMAAYTPTQLLPLYLPRPSQPAQEQALASIGATTAGGAL